MPGFGSLGKFFGKTASDAAGFAAGGAVARTLNPGLQDVTNRAWQKHPAVPLSPEEAALALIEGELTAAEAADEASMSGVNGDRFAKLRKIADEGVGLADAFELWRRNLLTDEQFTAALRKSHLETKWWAPLRGLKERLLSPADLAAARQQGFVSAERQRAESELQGIPNEDAEVLFQINGLPPGVAEGLEMLRRRIIDEDTFARIVAEGHTKTKYTPALLQLRHRLLSAEKLATLRLKGWISKQEAETRGALDGYDADEMEELFLAGGRPATTHQVWIGLKRGGKLEGASLDERETFKRAVVQSDIRPEYEPLLWAQRYTYPSAFALRGLTSTGAISEADATQILEYNGWEPVLAAKVASAWAGAKTTAAKEATATDELTLYDGLHIDRADLLERLAALGYSATDANRKADVLDARRVISARTAGIAATKDAFVKHGASDDDTRTRLTQLGVHAWAQPLMLDAWRVARIAAAPDLTVAQITRAYTRGALSAGDATTALEAQGYSAAEAATLLGIAGPALTVKQVQDAYKGGLRTRDEAAALLAGLGFTVKDASLLLGEAGAATDEAKIRTDLKAGTLAQAAAVAMLETLGYSAAAAAAYLEG